MSAILRAEAYARELAACLEAFIPESRAREHAEHAARLASVDMGRTQPNYGNRHTAMPENAAELAAKIRAAACDATGTPDSCFEYDGESRRVGAQARAWARVALVAIMGATNTATVLGDRRANVTTAARRYRESHPARAAEAVVFAKSLAVKP